jgi:hypothetical protein
MQGGLQSTQWHCWKWLEKGQGPWMILTFWWAQTGYEMPPPSLLRQGYGPITQVLPQSWGRACRQTAPPQHNVECRASRFRQPENWDSEYEQTRNGLSMNFNCHLTVSETHSPGCLASQKPKIPDPPQQALAASPLS